MEGRSRSGRHGTGSVVAALQLQLVRLFKRFRLEPRRAVYRTGTQAPRSSAYPRSLSLVPEAPSGAHG